MSWGPFAPGTIDELIHRRRRQILHHSILYYRLNVNHIDDHTFDAWAKELVELQRDHPEASLNVAYQYAAFKDFTGETGFDLPLWDPRAYQNALRSERYRQQQYKKEQEMISETLEEEGT